MIIFHGENTVQSRQELFEVRKKNNLEIITFTAGNFTLEEIKQALESRSLFGQERLVIFENLLSARKSKGQENIIRYLKDENSPDVILWEGQELKGLSKTFPKATIKIFKLDPSLFRLLDRLGSAENKKLVADFREAIIHKEAELVFHMLARHFRMLLFLNDGIKSGLEEIDRLADWQRLKLERQWKLFGREKLRRIYQRIFDIECNLKTGKSAFDLTKTLEVFLATL
ncbi:hypothetical protein HY439_00410 [Candidatus Microgenomates bacterium]|nr:hypothetical protein [Candidatus Microgenomates bacterium]